MNRIYKVIWNKAKHCYVVVSELAKSRTKSPSVGRTVRGSLAAVIAAAVISGGMMFMMPSALAADNPEAGTPEPQHYIAFVNYKGEPGVNNNANDKAVGTTKRWDGVNYTVQKLTYTDSTGKKITQNYWVRDGYIVKLEKNPRYDGVKKEYIVSAYKDPNYTGTDQDKILKNYQSTLTESNIKTLSGSKINDIHAGVYGGGVNGHTDTSSIADKSFVINTNGSYHQATESEFKALSKDDTGLYTYNGEVVDNSYLYAVNTKNGNEIGIFLDNGEIYKGQVFGNNNEVLKTAYDKDTGKYYSYWAAEVKDPTATIGEMQVGEFNKILNDIGTNIKESQRNDVKSIQATQAADKNGGTIGLEINNKYDADGNALGGKMVPGTISFTSTGGTGGKDVSINVGQVGDDGKTINDKFTLAAGSKVTGNTWTKKGDTLTTLTINGQEYAVPQDTNTTYTAGEGLTLTGTTFTADPSKIKMAYSVNSATTKNQIALSTGLTFKQGSNVTITDDKQGGITISSTDTDTYVTKGEVTTANGKTVLRLTKNGGPAIADIDLGAIKGTAYTAGNGINAIGADNKISVKAGNGVTVDTNGVSVNYGKGLKLDAADDNKLTADLGTGLKFDGNAITADTDTIKLSYGVGDTAKKQVSLATGLTFKQAGSVTVTDKGDGTIEISGTDTDTDTYVTSGKVVTKEDGKQYLQLSNNGTNTIEDIELSSLKDVYTGTGAVKVNGNEISVATGNGIDTTGDTLAVKAGNGVTVDTNGVSVNYGKGLKLDADDGNKLTANLGSGLKFDANNAIAADVNNINLSYGVGDAAKKQVSLATGLTFKQAGSVTVTDKGDGTIEISGTDTDTDTYVTSGKVITKDGKQYLQLTKNGGDSIQDIELSGIASTGDIWTPTVNGTDVKAKDGKIEFAGDDNITVSSEEGKITTSLNNQVTLDKDGNKVYLNGDAGTISAKVVTDRVLGQETASATMDFNEKGLTIADNNLLGANSTVIKGDTITTKDRSDTVALGIGNFDRMVVDGGKITSTIGSNISGDRHIFEVNDQGVTFTAEHNKLLGADTSTATNINGSQITAGAIKVNGESGATVTGLTNTEWSADGNYNSGRAATEEQLQKAINNISGTENGGFGLTADDGNSVTKKLGEKINVIGGKNINTTVDKDGLTVNLDDNITLGSGTTAVHINGEQGQIGFGSITMDGGKSNVQIGGVHITGTENNNFVSGLSNTTWDSTQNYSTSNKAATEAQLQTVSNTANAGWNVVMGDKTENVAPGASVNLTSNDGNIIGTLTKDVKTGNLTIDASLNDDITLGSANNQIKLEGSTGNAQIGGVQILGTKGSTSVEGLSNTTWNPNAIVSGRAATEDQLKTVSEVANTGWNLSTNKGEATTIKPGDTVDFSGDKNITVSNDGTNVSVKLKNHVTLDEKPGAKVDLNGDDGTISSEVTTTNEADGAEQTASTVIKGDTITVKDGRDGTDDEGHTYFDRTEINGGNITSTIGSDLIGPRHIFEVNENGVTFTAENRDWLGNSSSTTTTINGKQITAGSIIVNGETGGEHNSTIIGLTNTSWSGTTDNASRVATEGQLEELGKGLTNKGLTFAGNSGTVTKKLGETVTIKGEGAKDDSAYSGENVKTVVDEKGNLVVKLDKNMVVDSISAGDNVFDNTGLTIGGKGSNSIIIQQGNISMGGNQIHNVAAGKADTDAVNKSQLDQAIESAKGADKSLVQGAGKGGDTNKTYGEVTDNGDVNLRVEDSKGNGHDVTIKDVASKKQQDKNTAIIGDKDNNGLKDDYTGTKYISKAGTLVDADRKLDAAIKDLSGKVEQAQANHTEVSAGNGITVTDKGTADKHNYKVGLADDFTLGGKEGQNGAIEIKGSEGDINATGTIKSGDVVINGKDANGNYTGTISNLHNTTWDETTANAVKAEKDDPTKGNTASSTGATQGQLYDVDKKVNSNANQINNNTVNIQNNSNRITNLEKRMNDVESRIDKVGAMAAAMANLHTMGYDPAAPTEISAGIGQYKGETALAVGFFHYPNQDFMVSGSISVAGDEVMAGVGATWKIGRKTQAQLDAREAEKRIEKAAAIKRAAKDAEVRAQAQRHAQLLAEREAHHAEAAADTAAAANA